MICLCGVYILKNLFILTSNIFQAKAFSHWKEQLSTDAYQKLLQAPYEFHSIRSSTELAQLVIMNIPFVLNQFVDQIFSLISSVILCTAIVLFIIYMVSPFVILGVTVGVALLLLQHFAMRESSRRTGQAYFEKSNANMSILNQTFQAFKEVQMFQVYKRFSVDFHNNMQQLTQTEKWTRFYEKLPSLANEVVLICIMMVCMLLLGYHRDDTHAAYQEMGMLIVGFFRLIPTLNQISNSLVMLNRASSPLEHFIYTMDELERSMPVPRHDVDSSRLSNPDFCAITVDHVNQSFDGKHVVIPDLSLTIPRGSFQVITGPSGSGKSTLLNILMGFIVPVRGGIFIDGQPITDNLQVWQKRIAIVMQDFYILNSSLAENVAFGLLKDDIDTAKVAKVLSQVGLDELCAQKAEGIWMPVGENGKLLSGGQRQRVALARALYFDKDIWILDEVTSALDIKTEQTILETIKTLDKTITVIMSAHRLSVMPYADNIAVLKQGIFVAEGSFESLTTSNPIFQDMYPQKNTTQDAA